MAKKIIIALFILALAQVSFVQAYGWTTEACKKSGCYCVETPQEGKCVLTGNCSSSNCKIPICKTRPFLGGTTCYLFDQGECNEVYEAYKDCSPACKNLMEQFVSECRNDKAGKGEYYKIPIGECCNNPPKEVTSITQVFFGKTVNLKGEGLEDVSILIKCDNAKISQTKYVSVSNGDFEISVQAEKDKEVVCKMIFGNDDQLRVILTKVKPGNVGEVKVGTIQSYELDMKTSLMQMLIDSGVDKADATAYVSYINFKYSAGNPSFEEVTPSFITGKWYGQNYQISMDAQQYITDRETLYHEMTHAIAQKMFTDVAPPSPSHDIYEPLSPEGAFDEGRAHFFAYLMLKRTGEYDATKDQFTDDQVVNGVDKNKVDMKSGKGSSIEASIATFLKDYYVNIKPEDAWKDYMKTVEGCKETVGHSCQTIVEFINQKGFVNNGVLATAAKLGIKIDKDGTCIIKNGASYTTRDAKTIQLDSGDVECGSRNVQVNDVEIIHGGTQYVVSKTGADMSISVLDGTVTATDINSRETANVVAGNKVTYSSVSAKFSQPEKIDINNIEKFWEIDNQKESSKSLFYPVLAVMIILTAIVGILIIKKFFRKA